MTTIDDQRRQQIQVITGSSESNEWYTPAWIIDAVRQVLGSIDLDPASCAAAQQTIQATRYYTIADDGFQQEWAGRVFLNPPYGKNANAARWAQKLIADYQAGRVEAAILLIKGAFGYQWFEQLWHAWPACALRERVAFVSPIDGTDRGPAKHATVLLYLGSHIDRFHTVFEPFGRMTLPGTHAPSQALIPSDQHELVSAARISPALLAGQLAPSSIAKYTQDFAAFAAFADDAQSPAALARWRAHLAEQTTYSPHTINRMLAAVKRVMKEAADQGYIRHDVAAGFDRVRGVKPRALRSRLKRHSRTRISPADMRRLCEAPDRSSLVGARDAALLATLASSGLRESEAATLTIGQIEPRGKGYIVTVQGKTDTTPRDAPLSREAYRLMLEWIDKRPIMTTAIFTGFAGRGNRATDKPLSATSVWRIVQGYAAAVGLSHIKPHDFRRFVGTQLAASDIRKAQKALGHKNINTTAAHYVLDELEGGLTEGLY